MAHITDGYIPFRNYKTYYKIFGEQRFDTLPLLVLHGGPGSGHNYMLGLSELASDRQVIFYDQLGSGLSSHPSDDSLWTVPTFIEELEQVRELLGLTSFHLLGHSWGGMLAIDYLLTKPSGIASVVLGSAMISMPLYQKEVDILKKDLPKKTYDIMLTHEKAGTTDSKVYEEAYEEYDARHVYRHGKFPAKYEAPEGTFGGVPYRTMWGVNEAFANGDLKKWDRIAQLQQIKIPTLITSGQYDELTPHQALITHHSIPNSKIRIFTAGSHCAHVEFEKEYNETIAEFLAEIEGKKDK